MKNFVSFLALNVCLLSTVFGADEVEYREDLEGLSVRKKPSQQPAEEPVQGDEEGSATEPDYSDDDYTGRVSGKVLGQLRQKEKKADRRQCRPSEKSNHEEEDEDREASTTAAPTPRLKRTDKKQPSLSSLVAKGKSPKASTSSLPNPPPTANTPDPDAPIHIDAI